MSAFVNAVQAASCTLLVPQGQHRLARTVGALVGPLEGERWRLHMTNEEGWAKVRSAKKERLGHVCTMSKSGSCVRTVGALVGATCDGGMPRREGVCATVSACKIASPQE